jgi:Flp pilus assembly protein TadD
MVHALEINPKYTKAYLDLGLICLRRGQRERAIKAWRQALALDPENQLAKIYLRQAEGNQPASPA